MIMKTKTQQNKFIKIITLPIKALAKARDFYVRSMNNYADRVYYGPYGASGWAGTSYVDAFPRSVSVSSVRSNETDDYKELVRAASTSTLGNRVDLGSIIPNSSTRKTSTSSSLSLNPNPSSLLMLQQQKGNNNSNSNSNSNMFKGVPRSASVGMAKIEEEKPSEFGEIEDNNGNASIIKKKKSRFFPRSRSYAVAVSS